MENEMLDQMHKKLVWKITIQFIWILCITAMIVCIIYEGIMQVHRNHVWALGGMALILLITYFIWNYIHYGNFLKTKRRWKMS